jgi:hypothetical protein
VELFVEDAVLLCDELVGLAGDLAERLSRGESVGSALGRAGLHLFAQTGEPYLEEFVEVGAGDGEEAEPLEERDLGVGGLRQDPLIEGEDREFTVDVEARFFERALGGDRR